MDNLLVLLEKIANTAFEKFETVLNAYPELAVLYNYGSLAEYKELLSKCTQSCKMTIIDENKHKIFNDEKVNVFNNQLDEKQRDLLRDKEQVFESLLGRLKEKTGLTHKALSDSLLRAYARIYEREGGHRYFTITPDMVDKPFIQEMIDKFSVHLRDKGFIEYQSSYGSYKGMGRITTKELDHLAELESSAIQQSVNIGSMTINNHQKGFVNSLKNHKQDTIQKIYGNQYGEGSNQIIHGKESNGLLDIFLKCWQWVKSLFGS